MKIGRNILVILALLLLAQPADALIKRSRKSDCSVCHVLWMGTFSTNQKTLLGPTEANIVIAGSVGLSSSRRMCASCHDGYVQDSRTVIAAGNRHQQIRTPPDWLKLPDSLRLDMNNEFYCGTCHGFHDVRGMGEIGIQPFMRLDNERSEMCAACHTDKAEKLGRQNHPVGVKRDSLPRETIERLGGKFGPDGEIICQSCHLPHGKPALLAPLKGSALCLLCHVEKKSVLHSDHNLGRSAPDIRNSQGKDTSESGPCSSCHVPHNGKGRRIWAQLNGEGNPSVQTCLSCHGKKTGVKDIGEHSHPVGVASKTDSVLPLFSDTGQRQANGKVQCATCHDVHAWEPTGQAEYVNGMEGSAANSFLRITNQDSGLCISCHGDKQGVLQTDHDLRLSAPLITNSQGATPEVSGPCGVCHIPHNAAAVKLWAREPVSGNPATVFCLACHERETEYIRKTIGEHSHPVDVPLLTQSGAISGLPLFSENGDRSPSGRVQCATCHNPHQWNPDPDAADSAKNVEGDASNSFLRIANSPQSELCLSCHDAKKQVVASDHNLARTAPTEKNMLGAIPAESGLCGACHIPHNAAAKRLWAKSLAGESDFVTRLCSSCHKKNGAAGLKTVSAYSHPVDVALGKFDPGKSLDLPLYPAEEERETPGRVVCITCHDPHTWSPVPARSSADSALWTNREGDIGSSFLRKADKSGTALCKSCHQTKALVVGTPHDLGLTAPRETNVLGQTGQESGPCGVCHLVHNSPNDLKLWARPYGPAGLSENRMVALCTSCHAEGKVAEKKVQEIASHPDGTLTSYEKGFIRVVYEGMEEPEEQRGGKRKKTSPARYTPILINNVVGFSRGENYTPIFNNQGEEVNIGKISCPSCHNVHVRDYNQREGGLSKDHSDRQGSKFLRVESSQIICVECHGPDALYRYLYFHAPRSRAQGGK